MSKKKISFTNFILFITIILSILIFSVVSFIMYRNTTSFVKEKLRDTNYTNLLQISKNIDIYLNGFENIIDNLTQNSSLKKDIEHINLQSDAFEQIELYKEITDILEKSIKHTDGIRSVTLFTPDKVFTAEEGAAWDYNYKNLMESNPVRKIEQDGNRPILFYVKDFEDSLSVKGTSDGKNFFENGNIVIMGTIYSSNNIQGLLVLKIDENWIKKIMLPDSEIMIINQEGMVWTHSALLSDKFTEKIYAYIKDNNEGIAYIGDKTTTEILYKKLSLPEWYILYAGISGESDIKLKKFGLNIILVIIFSIILSVMLSKAFIKRALKPFYSIVKNAERYMAHTDVSAVLVDDYGNRLSIRERIMIFFAFVIIIPLVIYIGLYYQLASNLIIKETISSKVLSFGRTAANIEIMFERKTDALKNLSFDTTLQQILVKGNVTDANTEKIDELINNYTTAAGYYYNISIYNNNKQLIYAKVREEEKENYSNILDKVSEKGFYDIYSQIDKKQSGKNIIYLAFKIPGVSLEISSKYLNTIGYIIAEVDELQISDFYRDMSILDQAEIMVQDYNGLIVSHTDKNRIGVNYIKNDNEETGLLNLSNEITLNNENYLFLKGSFSVKTFNKDYKNFIMENIYILFIILLVLMIVSFEVSYYSTSSINKINSLLKKVKIYNINIEFPEENLITEISELGKTFNDMILRIDMLVDDLLITKSVQDKLESEKKDAEIIALQSQIKPHFLCNTLDSVRCLIKDNDTERAAEMLKQVSNLFRYGISKLETLITVDQELAYAKSYANIMEMRLSGRVTFKWNIDEKALRYKTLKMLLQPLIENSIDHGSINRGMGGTITVSCFLSNENIIFEVEDDGKGMDEYQLQNVMKFLDSTDGTKIGLSNVRKRLKIFYGENGSLEIFSQKGRGTRVIITIPANENF